MDFQEWLADFVSLHERAGKNHLTPQESEAYLASRNELARALLKAQQVAVASGQIPRKTLRAAIALPVELDLPTGKLKTITRDISAGGMSLLVPNMLSASAELPFILRLSRSEREIEGKARVVDTLSTRAQTRVGLMFEGLSQEHLERIEFVVFSAVLALLRRPEGVAASP